MKRSALMLAVATLTAGCTVLGLGDSVADELRDEKSAWLRLTIKDYSYEYERSCFCPVVGRVIIEVRDDVVRSVRQKETGLPVSEPHVPFYTVPQLYDYLIDAAHRADKMNVDFDRRAHLPASVSIDFAKNAIDDEVAIATGNFSALD